jgi:ribosome biogenesis SPOUT family RNA methylase Rps3
MKTQIRNNEHNNRSGYGFHDINKGRSERSFTPEEMEIYYFMMGGILGK